MCLVRVAASVATLSLIAASLVISAARAQDVIAYPAAKQTPEQQSRDRYECHSWAVQQSGFDPSQQQVAQGAPPPPPAAPQGGAVRGAARGAALGAVGGAIGGDAGKGAAIGAGTGALFGAMRKADQRRQQDAYQQQYAQTQQSGLDAQRSTYNRALTACLEGRGYRVN
jgi:hypothetical protein